MPNCAHCRRRFPVLQMANRSYCRTCNKAYQAANKDKRRAIRIVNAFIERLT